MKKQKILAGNKLIAEFMGWYKPDEENYYIHRFSDKDYTDKQLKYHTSWDWLMPVYIHITSLKLYANRGNEGEILYGILVDRIVDGCTLEEVFDSIIKFIEWYNETL